MSILFTLAEPLWKLWGRQIVVCGLPLVVEGTRQKTIDCPTAKVNSIDSYVARTLHQTFALSREPYLEPIERLSEAAGPDESRICLRQIGREFHFLS